MGGRHSRSRRHFRFLENFTPPHGDTHREALRWQAVVERWWVTHGSKHVSAQTLLKIAEELVPDDGRGVRSRSTRPGAVLSRNVGATFAGGSVSAAFLKIARAPV